MRERLAENARKDIQALKALLLLPLTLFRWSKTVPSKARRGITRAKQLPEQAAQLAEKLARSEVNMDVTPERVISVMIGLVVLAGLATSVSSYRSQSNGAVSMALAVVEKAAPTERPEVKLSNDVQWFEQQLSSLRGR